VSLKSDLVDLDGTKKATVVIVNATNLDHDSDQGM
jgi:hypothetical protein